MGDDVGTAQRRLSTLPALHFGLKAVLLTAPEHAVKKGVRKEESCHTCLLKDLFYVAE